MKIVHLCLSCFYLEGYAYQENMLPKYHTLAGHDVTVIASLESKDSSGNSCVLPAAEDKMIDGYRLIRLNYRSPFKRLFRYLRSYTGFYKTLCGEHPDIIFMHDYAFIDVLWVILYAMGHRSVRIYSDCHTDYINSARTWFSKHIIHHVIWRGVGKILTPFVKCYYGVTPGRCDFLKTAYHIPEQKIKLLEMGVDDFELQKKNREKIRAEIRSKLDIPQDAFVIVSGGKLDKRKNIHLLVEAFNKLESPDFYLVIFGCITEDLRPLVNLDDWKKNRKIRYIPWLTPDGISDMFMASDIGFFPGTHSVIWEQAVGLQLPCVFKYWEGFTHVDLGGNCKFLKEVDVPGLAQELSALTTDREAYRKMKHIASDIACRHFYYSEIAAKAIDMPFGLQ